MSVTFTTVMVWVECYKCHVPFGITEDHQNRLLKSHKTFYCPNGHGQGYYGRTPDEKRIDQLERQLAMKSERAAELAARTAALSSDIREAQERALKYSNPQRGAFWRGHEDRRCGREEGCCPYPDNKFGFRAAWLDGFGAEEVVHGGT